MASTNPYELLEVSPDASAEEIKAAYLRLAKQWHPDRFAGAEKPAAEDRFRALNEAYNQVKDPVRRPTLPQPTQGSGAAPVVQAPGGKPPQERSAEDWFNEARQMKAQGDWQRALALTQYAIRMDGAKAPFYTFLAELQDQSGDKRGAIKSLESAVRLDPRDVDSTLHMADLYLGLGMKARAEGLLQQARKLSPKHPRFKPAAPAAEKKQGKAAAGDPPAGLADQAKALWGRLTRKG